MSPVPARSPNQGKTLSFEEILERLQASFPETVACQAPNGARWVRVDADRWPEIARFLRESPELAFEQLPCLSGLDLKGASSALSGGDAGDDLACVYELWSLSHRHGLRVRVQVSREHPVIPSCVGVWGAALLNEREVFDLYGIEFPGHPDLRRLMMPPDWEGHPLRKDYLYPEAYAGVELRREGQTFESGPYK